MHDSEMHDSEMPDSNPPPAPEARPLTVLRSLSRAALMTALVALGAACGGGGGGSLPPPPVVPVDGLSGRVLLPDTHVGRIIEQEPNDDVAQAFRLPPAWPRGTLEVTGQLGATAAHFERVDRRDVLLFTAIQPQAMTLELEFLEDDPITTAPNDFDVAVVRRATGVQVAVTGPGGSPRSLTFDAAADEEYEIAVTATFGHGWYVMRLTGVDAGVAPPPSKPAALSAPAARTALAVPARPLGADRSCAGTHVLVRFEATCDREELCTREGLTLGRRTGTGSYLVHLADEACGEDHARALATRLGAVPGVTSAEPDWVVRTLSTPNDPEFNRQWNMRAIGAPSAWDIETGDESIVVAVVDAGIVAHPDLAGRLVPGYDFVSSAEVAADGDGRDTDPTDPGDQASSSGLSLWHGTHVASIIAANQDDGYGCTGVAPGCRVMMLRALGLGGGFVSDASDAILFAAGRFTTADGSALPAPVRVINLSIGLDQDSQELRDACQTARDSGSFLIAAVGNNGGSVQYPARYPSTFAVSAVDGKLLTTAYSSFGATVDIAAPGGGTNVDQWNDGWHDGVLSAVRDETVDPAVWAHGYLVGTSQAAPHVAGAAALLLSMDPSLTTSDLDAILRATALDLGQPGDDIAYGSGLLQVHEAVKIVLERLGNPRNDAPYLMLPTESVQFEGLRSSIDIPLANGGGGTLNIFFAIGVTDDGGDWLTASLDPDSAPEPPVNNTKVTINVERAFLPPGAGYFGGTVRLGNSLGSQGTIRVVVYVSERSRAGQILPVAAIDANSNIARRKAYAFPEFGYRYWIRGIPEATYHLQSGEDIDFDGFFCESFEACGWLGGPTQDDAIAVPFVPDEPAVKGLSIELKPPP